MEFFPRAKYKGIDELLICRTPYEEKLRSSNNAIDQLAYVVLQGRAVIEYFEERFEDCYSSGIGVQKLLDKLVGDAEKRYDLDLAGTFPFFETDRILNSLGESSLKKALEAEDGAMYHIKTGLASLREYAQKFKDKVVGKLVDLQLGGMWGATVLELAINPAYR
ncbi:hypothetical protein HOC01_04980 [archaeon]|jgi:hypothetical protein|nr:hypothetical protein [archaeon]MBT6698322.1 hypothetical protein [archaeon]